MTKTEKPKKEKFPIYPIEDWSVSKYGVKLYVNPDWGIALENGISLDVEDDEQGNFIGLGIYCPRLNVCYYWSDFEMVKKFSGLPKFIAHNGRTDLMKLKKWGFKVTEDNLLWDTQLIAHIMDSSRRRYGLKHLAKEDLGIEYPSYEDLCGKKDNKNHTTLDKLDLDLVANYNACDVYCCFRLFQEQIKNLHG